MSLTKPQLIIVSAIGLVVLFFALVFLGVLPGFQNKNNPQNIAAKITMWGLFDKESAYGAFFKNFKQLYPRVQIQYQSFDNADTYRSSLLDALASGSGPDIFMIQNVELEDAINKIAPFPASKISLKTVRDLFPQSVEADFVRNGVTYALPASLDTLALIYNRDALDGAAVFPPETWNELIAAVPHLVRLDTAKNISRAAVALGGSEKTVRHASDILSALMFQTGTQMISSDGSRAAFSSSKGLEALNFYTQFANAGSDSYTWNDTLPQSLDAFAKGFATMVFDYAESVPLIKSRNAFANIGIAPLPQPQGTSNPITYARYWGYAVSRQSKNQPIAWDVILSLTRDPVNAGLFFDATRKPPALRSLIQAKLNDPDIGIFARQALIGKSWPQRDPDVIEKLFSNLIESVNAGRGAPRSLLQATAERVSELIAKRSPQF